MAYTKKKPTGIMANIREFVVLLLIVFLIRTFGFGLYQVPTGSMETTMLVGERFFADKFSYVFRSPRHSEIIAMNDPLYPYSNNYFKQLFERYVWGPSNWTKRVIGEPGDTVKGVIEDNKPVIYLKKKGEQTFEKLYEPYLNKYPLIYVRKEDPEILRINIEREIAKMSQSNVPLAMVEKVIKQKFGNQTSPRSYDPSAPFDSQPFYRINPSRIVRDSRTGEMEIIYPGTPRPSSNPLAVERIAAGKNYWDGSDEFYIHLKDDELWCMGDNRLGSNDCRTFGPVKQKQIHGRIVFRIWSIDSDDSWWIVDLIKHPIDFWSRVRWSRFFQFVS
jgi:signal peptidase I